MTCAWIDTSSADTGSSAMMNDGFERQRAREADALALAAAELVRVALEVGRIEADQREQLGDAVAPLGLARRAGG